MNTYGVIGVAAPPPSTPAMMSTNNFHPHNRFMPYIIAEEEEARKKRAMMPPVTATSTSKAIAIIHITSFIVLVSPHSSTAEEETQAPRDDTVLDGTLQIVMDKPRVAKSIRVSLIATCRLQIPGRDEWQEKTIFKRSVEIGGENADQEAGIRLEKGSQAFGFALIVPSTLATYDKHPNARISHVLRATVEGFPQSTSSTFNIFGGIGKGKQRSSSRASSSRAPSPGRRSRPGSRAPSPSSRAKSRDPASIPPSRAPSPNGSTTGGGAKSPRLSLAASNNHTLDQAYFDYERGRKSTPSTTPPISPSIEYKDLKQTLTAERHVVIVANPPQIEGLRNYSFNKTGKLAGVGEWKWNIHSDALTVGSYLKAKLAFIDLNPWATIFAVRLLLSQTHSVTSPDEPGSAPFVYPKRNFVIATEGTIPTDKKPGPHLPALWRGSLVDSGDTKAEGSSSSTAISNGVPDSNLSPDFKLNIGMKRLPDDTKARPSTMEGTITPVKVSHEFVLQVFFNVQGTDAKGAAIPGDHGPGVMRMMMVTTPVVLPSVSPKTPPSLLVMFCCGCVFVLSGIFFPGSFTYSRFLSPPPLPPSLPRRQLLNSVLAQENVLIYRNTPSSSQPLPTLITRTSAPVDMHSRPWQLENSLRPMSKTTIQSTGLIWICSA